MTDSPLLQADADSLTVLFESDPLTLTDAQTLTAITELRRRRNVFASEEAAKALAPKKTRTKAQPAANASQAAQLDKPIGEVSLDDL